MELIEKIRFIQNRIDGFSKIKLKFLDKNKKKCIENIYDRIMNNIPNDKKTIRTRFKEERAGIEINVIKEHSLKINKKVCGLKEFKKAETVFCYISFDSEIDTFYILDYCLKNGKILSVPVIQTGVMIASIIDNLKNLKANRYGILEPKIIHEIHKNRIDVTIVPALGYNHLGFRIGYGKGYYDDFLKDYNGLTIGMAFKDFVSTELVPDFYDVPVKKLVIL